MKRNFKVVSLLAFLSLSTLVSCNRQEMLPNTTTPNPTTSVQSTITTQGSAMTTEIAKPTAVTISAAGDVTKVEVGKTLQLTATVTPSSVSQEVEWSSATPAIATVNSKGLLTAVSKGAATIKATSKVDASISSTFNIEVTGENTSEPSTDFATMAFTSHEAYVSGEKDSPIKAQGIVTYILPVDSKGTFSYYLNNGNDGYFVKGQDSSKKVELGKAYEVGGYLDSYAGLPSISKVEYFKTSTSTFTANTIDVSEKDTSSYEAMKPYIASKVSVSEATIKSIPSIASKAYSVDVTTKNGKALTLRIDPKNAGQEVFNAISDKFKSAVEGQKISLQGYMSAYGYGDIEPQIVVTSENAITLASISDKDYLEAMKEHLTLPTSIPNSQTKIDLPVTLEDNSKINIAWSSSNTAVISNDGKVTPSSEDTDVTLTATLTYKEETATKTFVLTVLGPDSQFTAVETLDLEDAKEANKYGVSQTKPSYNSEDNTVELGTPKAKWLLENTLIANDGKSDRANGKFAMRSKAGKAIDNTGHIESEQSFDANYLQFAAGAYGSHPLTTQLQVKFSIDEGKSWIAIEKVFVVNTASLQVFRLALPTQGKPVRIAIFLVPQTGGTINIDDLKLLKK